MEKVKLLIPKFFYGFLFAVVLPLILVFWSLFTEDIISLPVPVTSMSGWIILITGLILIFSGFWYIWKEGQGLPMNAFPPGRFVKNGIYAILRHPIYTGAVLICFGVSAAEQSASGFWMVSPLFMLLVIAYVIGFEDERTKALFGKQDYKPLISLPEDLEEKPSQAEKISVYMIAYLPLLVLYAVFRFIGASDDSLFLNFYIDETWPIWEISAVFYLFSFLPGIIVPLVIKTKRQLRNIIIDIWFCSVITGLLYFVFPLAVERNDFTPHSLIGSFINSYYLSGPVNTAIISISVFSTLIPLKYYSKVLRYKRGTWYIIAAAFLFFGITSGNYSLISLFAGILIFLITILRTGIWNSIRMLSEKIANSWMEWRFGPLRIINHGFYGGAAGFAGMLIAGTFLGDYAIAGFIVVLSMIVGAGLWAQLIEGSPRLLRPYGYYGGLLGAVFACTLITIFSQVGFFYMLGAFAMAAPWIQCFGRLRCLVQGCCHGKPSGSTIGLRFDHPKSRVNKISGLKGVYLHPTQLYSIGTNMVTGLILIRFYSLGMPSPFICGIYLILNGTGRFVEEAFRGEIQTPYWAGMRIYQWIALASILTGIVFTTFINTEPLIFQPNFESLYMAFLSGLIVTFASGADFPESDRRFARLTS